MAISSVCVGGGEGGLSQVVVVSRDLNTELCVQF